MRGTATAIRSGPAMAGLIGRTLPGSPLADDLGPGWHAAPPAQWRDGAGYARSAPGCRGDGRTPGSEPLFLGRCTTVRKCSGKDSIGAYTGLRVSDHVEEAKRRDRLTPTPPRCRQRPNRPPLHLRIPSRRAASHNTRHHKTNSLNARETFPAPPLASPPNPAYPRDDGHATQYPGVARE